MATNRNLELTMPGARVKFMGDEEERRGTVLEELRPPPYHLIVVEDDEGIQWEVPPGQIVGPALPKGEKEYEVVLHITLSKNYRKKVRSRGRTADQARARAEQAMREILPKALVKAGGTRMLRE